MLRHIKQWFHAAALSVRGFFVRNEDIASSKQKWNRLAKSNARYYVLTDKGENISEEEFREAGRRDFTSLIQQDQVLLEQLGDLRSKNVLEIGCGIGRITEFIADHVGHVTGIDISEDMIAEAGRRLAGKTNVTLRATDGVHYPFADNEFDLVFSFIVFQHMPDKTVIRQNVQEISRVLKRGGIAKIQLRGAPVAKGNWYYGPAFSGAEVRELIDRLPLEIIQEQGEGERYYWIWLHKKP